MGFANPCCLDVLMLRIDEFVEYAELLNLVPMAISSFMLVSSCLLMFCQ